MRITEVQEPYRYLYKGQSVWLATIRFSGKRPDLGTILVANNQHLIVAMHLHGDHLNSCPFPPLKEGLLAATRCARQIDP